MHRLGPTGRRVGARVVSWFRLLASALVVIACSGVAFFLVRNAGLASFRTTSEHGAPATMATVPTDARNVAFVPFDEAWTVLTSGLAERPEDLKASSRSALEAVWPEWIRNHDAEIRGRLARGDEDSIVNLWLYGTTFTALPRATRNDISAAAPQMTPEQLLLARLDDLVAGAATPDGNERLRFTRTVIERHGIDLATDSGREAAERLLIGIRERMLQEARAYRDRMHQSARSDDELDVLSTLYEHRGLSSDTSVPIEYAVDRAIADLGRTGRLVRGGVHRVAIVGPGLDFADKSGGYDFYPVQTIQPFALIDSLRTRGLAAADLRVATFDVSPRVTQHVRDARARAARGAPYRLILPLPADAPPAAWSPELAEYWRGLGAEIGTAGAAFVPSSAVGRVRLRAVAVEPAVVASLVPHDLDIVTERLLPGTPVLPFDLVVATNVLVYYDRFDQALALSNIASMLRRGGGLLTNYEVHPLPPLEPVASATKVVAWDNQGDIDTMFWYARR